MSHDTLKGVALNNPELKNPKSWRAPRCKPGSNAAASRGASNQCAEPALVHNDSEDEMSCDTIC